MSDDYKTVFTNEEKTLSCEWCTHEWSLGMKLHEEKYYNDSQTPDGVNRLLCEMYAKYWLDEEATTFPEFLVEAINHEKEREDDE